MAGSRSWLETLLVLVVLVEVVPAAAERTGRNAAWTYEGESGPEQWPDIGFSNCDGQRQSPINVVTNHVVLKRFKPLQFQNFDQVPLNMSLYNNHHTAAAKMTWREVPKLSGGGLPGEYEVANFHFHWGKDDFKGSEHTIDGESYPLEMHVVCKNTKYADLTDALHHPDGLAVLGVMYEVLELGGRALRRLDSALRNITTGGATVEVSEPPSLTEMMPRHVADFYRYDGSLTTPGCHEAVTWTVFLETVPASSKQMALFRALMKNPEPIGYNYRPPQRRHGRNVYLSTSDDPALGQVTVQATVGPARGSASRWMPLPPLMTMVLVMVLM